MRRFAVVNVEQGEPAWFQARIGRLTGSVAGDMLAKIKSGEAAGRRNLRMRLVLERLTGKPQESDFISKAMQVGKDREPLAFAAYENMTGDMAERSGFLMHTEHWAGCSLDGHLHNFQKLVSIKCRQPAAHYGFLRTGTIPADAMAQIRHELWITDALEHDYLSWNPEFPESLQARIATVRRQDADIPAYEDEALAFLADVDREVAAVQTMDNVSAVMEKVVANAS